LIDLLGQRPLTELQDDDDDDDDDDTERTE